MQHRPDGRVAETHDARRNMDIHHGLDGGRRVSVERADHSRIFAERGRAGYIQRPYSFHNHDFARRTYYYHGRSYDRYYRGYAYRGAYLSIYAPGRYYGPGFYGWAYNPWARPVIYPWGWGGSPWAGYYGYYFSPYPAYPNASLWLTDYMISSDLQAQYQAAEEAQTLAPASSYAGGSAPQLTPEVKQLIADEVRGEIALENSESQQNAGGQDIDPASSGIARLVSDRRPHVFVAGGPLDVVDASGGECPISDGDVLQMATPPAPDATAAELSVLSSKGGSECPKSDTVNVALTDLQEMQNHMRERIDQGLEELQSKQGQSGLPAAPPSATVPPVTTAFAAIAPPPDPNGVTEISQELKDADQSEHEVVTQAQQEAASGPGPSAGPSGMPTDVSTPAPTIALGQSFDQVKAAFGQPLDIIDLGRKKIYKYKGLKVTFQDGKVADVE